MGSTPLSPASIDNLHRVGLHDDIESTGSPRSLHVLAFMVPSLPPRARSPRERSRHNHAHDLHEDPEREGDAP